ncbi:Hypothetical predicted protein [Podarcis lilfordi]|uniref:Uncharacterized protein n=1 Tax=Podarcis lilfordi TaxID=74358 RepID=A0AA35KDD0_9SAUR|nr:Hypothetical predicted protein [Podarcis lilfordi]
MARQVGGGPMAASGFRTAVGRALKSRFLGILPKMSRELLPFFWNPQFEDNRRIQCWNVLLLLFEAALSLEERAWDVAVPGTMIRAHHSRLYSET